MWLSVAGHEIEIGEGGRLVPTSPGLADGAVYAAVLGVLGVVLARWVPSPAAGSVAVVGLFVLTGAVSSETSNWASNLAPWVTPYSDPGSPGWHLLYLTAVAVFVGWIAVLKHGMSRSVGLGLGVGVALAAAAGTASTLLAT